MQPVTLTNPSQVSYSGVWLSREGGVSSKALCGVCSNGTMFMCLVAGKYAHYLSERAKSPSQGPRINHSTHEMNKI
jgi:hypothetical protein